MTIRPYVAADKEKCIATFKSNMPKYFAEHELADFEEWLDEQPERHTVGGTDEYFVVELDDKIIACGGYAYDKEKNEARLTWGLVNNSLHKQGIGRMFVEYRVKAVKNQFPSCHIALDTTQHVYPFFEKLGFKTTQVTENFYSEGLHRYDMELC